MILRELLSVFGIDFDDTGQKKAEAALDGLKGKSLDVGAAFSQLKSLVAGSGIVGVFVAAANAAAEAAATQKRTTALFGEGAESVRAWSESAGQSMGRQGDTLLGLANSMKPVADSITDNETEAAAFSTTLAELAVNMGSFFGESDEDALNALRMGLMGADRGLKKYGIRLSDEALQEFAVSRGIRKRVKDMKDSEKAQLRYAKILASTTKFQGAARKNLDEYSGAKKRFTERAKGVLEALGSGLLPILTKVFTVVSVGIERFLACRFFTLEVLPAV